MKISPVKAELFHAEKWTDMIKLIYAFYKSVNASKIQIIMKFLRSTRIFFREGIAIPITKEKFAMVWPCKRMNGTRIPDNSSIKI